LANHGSPRRAGLSRFAQAGLGIGILAPTRRLQHDLIRRIRDRRIEPGRVFDVRLPLDQEALDSSGQEEREAFEEILSLMRRRSSFVGNT